MPKLHVRYAARNAAIMVVVVLLFTAVFPAYAYFDDALKFLSVWSSNLFDKGFAIGGAILAVLIFLTSLRGPGVRASSTHEPTPIGMGPSGEIMNDGFDVKGRPFGLQDD